MKNSIFTIISGLFILLSITYFIRGQIDVAIYIICVGILFRIESLKK